MKKKMPASSLDGVRAQSTKTRKKNAAAVALGRKGGLKGGVARANRLSAEQRREIAKKAAMTRWNKTK
jgi:hypothetical protein